MLQFRPLEKPPRMRQASRREQPSFLTAGILARTWTSEPVMLKSRNRAVQNANSLSKKDLQGLVLGRVGHVRGDLDALAEGHLAIGLLARGADALHLCGEPLRSELCPLEPV